MKKAIALLLILALTIPTFALVESGQVEYTGGSIANLAVGSMGRFDFNRPDALVFSTSTGNVAIPYASITRFHYEEKLARHLGVVLTIAVVLVKHRQRRHFVDIAFKDKDDKEQVALFEIAKDDVDATKATLEARTAHLRCPFRCR